MDMTHCKKNKTIELDLNTSKKAAYVAFFYS